MVGFELKALVVIAIIACILIAGKYNKNKPNGNPHWQFIVLALTGIILFIYGLYLNEHPVILF